MEKGLWRLFPGLWLAMKTTGEARVSKTRQEIIKEAKRIEESALYSSKGQFVAAYMWSNFHLAIGLLMVIGTAGAAALALSPFDPRHTWAAMVYIVVAVLSAILTFLNPNERSASHHNAGNHYDSLMSRVRVFWTIQCGQEDSEAELAARLEALGNEKDRLNLSSPQIPYWAYRIAKRQIAAGEASFRVDKEKSELV